MLFGSSGIRGLANRAVTSELALQVGGACGALYGDVVVGYDPRTTSDMLHHAVIAGVLQSGGQVTDLGLVSTPTLAHAARVHAMGIMITASHNPASYNGLKLFNQDGSGFSWEQSVAVEANFNSVPTDWSEVKQSERNDHAVEDHIEAILDVFPEVSSAIKVVVDCSNGSTGTITPYLLQRMGCEVVTLNAQPDGFFSAHAPEPSKENLLQLTTVVNKYGANLGIAHDCDGDRMVGVTEDGNLIPNDSLIAIVARHTAEQGIVVVPVNASRLIDDYLPQARVERTKVGDIFVSQRLKELEGDFGAEPSGTYVFPSFSYCPDGVYAAAELVHLAASLHLLDELTSLPCYHTLRTAVPVSSEVTEGMMGLQTELASIDHLSLTTIDGIRLDQKDAWCLVRPSGTEPKIRITVEALDTQYAKDLLQRVLHIVTRCFT